MVAAVKDGAIPQGRAPGHMLMQDLRYHGLRLVLFGAAVQHPQGFARSQFAPEPFFEKMGVVTDEVVCALQDTARGTVVLLQFD